MTTLYQKALRLFRKPDDHGGVIEWDERCDVPPVASRPAPLEAGQDEALWQEFVDLESRPAPLEVGRGKP